MPRSLAFIWSADKTIDIGVLDDQSLKHGLWVKFSEDKATEAKLWNNGHQVGLTKLSDSGKWETQVKVNGFYMPQNPITAWHEINDGLYDIAYAKTLINLKNNIYEKTMKLAHLALTLKLVEVLLLVLVLLHLIPLL